MEIRRLRREMGKTQVELAKEAKISQSALSQVESDGDWIFSAEVVSAIEKALKIQENYLVAFLPSDHPARFQKLKKEIGESVDSPTLKAIPNKEFFQANSDAVHGIRSLSKSDIRNLLTGLPVLGQTIERIARHWNVSIAKLVIADPDRRIPKDAAWIETLKHACYLDNNRYWDGKKYWYREEVNLKRASLGISEDLQFLDGQLIFAGNIKNQFGNTFNAIGHWINDHHFSLTGRSTDNASAASFDTAYSMRMTLSRGDNDINVLCGTWSGLDHLLARMAVYRIFLSDQELSIDEIQDLTNKTPIEPVFQANAFGKSY